MYRGIGLLLKVAICASLINSLTSCYFFRDSKSGQNSTVSSAVGENLGEKAGGLDEAALAEVHAITTEYPAAALRPDPDLVVRNLLLEYRELGSTVAREIGRVEAYRLLLGGANQDFTITAQETYDATSLLAKLKVAEEICGGLVAPNNWQQPGWNTILPAPPDQADTNLRFLTQRLLGVPSNTISEQTIASLGEILDTAVPEGVYENQSYIPVCATLIMDANFLLL